MNNMMDMIEYLFYYVNIYVVLDTLINLYFDTLTSDRNRGLRADSIADDKIAGMEE